MRPSYLLVLPCLILSVSAVAIPSDAPPADPGAPTEGVDRSVAIRTEPVPGQGANSRLVINPSRAAWQQRTDESRRAPAGTDANTGQGAARTTTLLASESSDPRAGQSKSPGAPPARVFQTLQQVADAARPAPATTPAVSEQASEPETRAAQGFRLLKASQNFLFAGGAALVLVLVGVARVRRRLESDDSDE